MLKVEEIHIKNHVFVMEKEHPVNARRRLGYSRNMCECISYVLYLEGYVPACTAHLSREQ